MSMTYLKSTDVKVFPTAHRTGLNGNESSFRLSEKHLGELLTLTLRSNKFVKEISGVLYIVVFGHIFEIVKSVLTTSFGSDTSIWAHASEHTIDSDFGKELKRVEGDSLSLDDTVGGVLTFLGIGFDTSCANPGDGDLLILSRASTSDSWEIPAESKVLMNLSDISNDVEGTPVTEEITLSNVSAETVAVSDSITVGSETTNEANITGTVTRAEADKEGRVLDDTYLSNVVVGSAGTPLLIKYSTPNGQTINMNLLDLIYPVGSIYMSIDSTSPASRFGGTWERIQDTYLACKGPNWITENTGGLTSYTPEAATLSVTPTTLTLSQIPAHSHPLNFSVNTTSDLAAPDFSFYLRKTGDGMQQVFGGVNTGTKDTDEVTANKLQTYIQNSSGNTTKLTFSVPYHHHSISIYGKFTDNKGGGGSHSHGITYLGKEINFQPSYTAVYVWKRTA